MVYRWSITTPLNTLSTSKQTTLLQVCKGVIHQIDIVFPPGSAGLLHLHINDALHQVWPYNTGQDFSGHNFTIRFREFIPVLHEPYQFTAYTWNDDDTYDHILIIRLGILPIAVIAPWLLTFEERLESALGGI
jgi:hypothetical protein